MKLRIKGNSIRLRLSKTEVSELSAVGHVSEETFFANSSLVYVLKQAENINELKADFIDGIITVSLPKILAKEWPLNDVISLDNKNNAGDVPALYILIEKDFKCLDTTNEDQWDNYENPKTTC